MKRFIPVIVALGVITPASAAMAADRAARDVQQDRQDLRQDYKGYKGSGAAMNQNIRDRQSDLKEGNTAAANREGAQIRKQEGELRQDRHDIATDRQEGHRDVRTDSKDISRDTNAFHNTQQDMRQDKAARTRDIDRGNSRAAVRDETKLDKQEGTLKEQGSNINQDKAALH